VAPDQLRGGVDLVLEAAGRIEVVALRPDGTPARNLLVTARHEAPEGERAEPRTGFVGGEGKAVLEGLAPGPWRVTLRPVGPGTGDAELPPQVVEVQAERTVSASFSVP
jgi:hypothetical protein